MKCSMLMMSYSAVYVGSSLGFGPEHRGDYKSSWYLQITGPRGSGVNQDVSTWFNADETTFMNITVIYLRQAIREITLNE